MTSLKVLARKAFLQEPPFPDSVFEEFSDVVIKELEQHMRNTIPNVYPRFGFDLAIQEMLRFLRGTTE